MITFRKFERGNDLLEQDLIHDRVAGFLQAIRYFLFMPLGPKATQAVKIALLVIVTTGFTGFGFTQQLNILDRRREETFKLINEIKEEMRPGRVALLRQQGRLPGPQ